MDESIELIRFVKEKLRHVDSADIVFTEYAKKRAAWRNINYARVYTDILNPNKLVAVQKQ